MVAMQFGIEGILAETDDLTPNEFQALLVWLWAFKWLATPANIRRWRMTERNVRQT